LSQLSCPFCHVLAILSFQFLQGLYVQVDLSGRPVFSDLSRLSHYPSSVALSWMFCYGCPLQVVYPGCPAPDVLSFLSCSGHPVQADLSGLVCQVCPQLSCPLCHALVVMFFTIPPKCPVLAIPSRMSCSTCHVLAVMFWPPCFLYCIPSRLSCPGCYVQVVMSRLTCPSWLLPTVLPRLSCPGCPATFAPSWLSCPGYPVPVPVTLSLPSWHDHSLLSVLSRLVFRLHCQADLSGYPVR
jgi:hypothetical protein